MKSLLLFLILGVAILLSLKAAVAFLAMAFPLLVISLVMAVPVAFLLALGWGVTTLFRGVFGSRTPDGEMA